jgi:hypothetical protein
MGTALPGSSVDFGKLLAEETNKWGKVIKLSAISRNEDYKHLTAGSLALDIGRLDDRPPQFSLEAHAGGERVRC